VEEISGAGVGRGVRAFVGVFLALFVGCGLLQVEAWPFSGWRLFSELRTDEVRGWLATSVDAAGIERPIPFGSFPDAYRGQLHVLQGFEGLSTSQRLDVCHAWARELAAGTGIDAVEIRIYATTDSARAPDGGERQLRHTCPEP
jgi:hypothetical protein